MPVLDGAATLDLAIRSVFCQTWQDWELLVIDDGSQDETVRRLRAIDDDRVRVLADGQRRGVAARRNQLACEARGAWVAFLDADDAMDPRRLEVQQRFLERFPDVDAVASGWMRMSGTGHPTDLACMGPLRQHPLFRYRPGWLPANTLMIRTDLLREVGFREDLRRSEDYDFLVRASARARFEKLGQPLYFYREDVDANWERYLLSWQESCALLVEYRRQVGLPVAASLWAYLAAKRAVYRLALALGLGPHLTLTFQGRREMDASARARAEAKLSKILSTPVPGWPSIGDLTPGGTAR